MNFIFETLDVCGKTFTVIPGYSVIGIPVLLAFIFIYVVASCLRYWPLIPAIFFLIVTIFFVFYKEHLADNVTRTLLEDSQCIDAAFMIKNRMYPNYSIRVYLSPKDIPNYSILQYQGSKTYVLEELAERYEFGINGFDIDVQKANEIKEKVKRIEEENK